MKRIFAALLLALVSAPAFAQPSIGVQAPNLVSVSEQFNVTFTIEGEKAPKSFNWTQGEDFQLVWGPQKGSSSSISIINGKTTRSSQTTYTYVLLPKKTGTFTLAQAEAVIDGKTVRSKSTAVQVVADASSSRSSSSAQDQTPATGSVPAEDLFMRLTVSKSRAVVGETLSASLKLYQRTSLSGIEDARFPSFNGFWSQETQAPSNIEFHRESVGELIYNVALLRSWTLIPQQSGDITIDPAELVCQVAVRAPSSRTGSIFDSFFQDDYRTVRKRLVTEPHTIHVSPLPGGAPSSFGGGVGKFSMSASLGRDSLRSHDASSLKVTVTGSGNVALLEAPRVSFPPDFEVYDVKSTDTAQGKTFEYPFIPRSHGDFVIGPVEYSYYDVSAGRYVTLSSPPMSLSVSRGSEQASYGDQTAIAPIYRKDVKNLGSDVRYISTSLPDFSRKGSVFAGSLLFWLIALFIVLASGVVYFVLKARARLRADTALTRSRSATKMARRRLSRAQEYLARDVYAAFYEELHRTLVDYIADKFGMDMADMSKENIASRLAEGGVPPEACAEFTDLLDACEFARYSPSSDKDAMSAHFEKAVSVISIIDDSMKKKHKSAPLAPMLLLFLLFGAGARGAGIERTDSLWSAGVLSYESEAWEEASRSWISIADMGMESPELYTNIGNAFFKQNDYGRAILYYRRALKLDPSFADARFNLDLALGYIQDNVESVPEFFLKTWIRSLSYIFPSVVWAVIALCMLALALLSALAFLLCRSGRARKTGFFAGLAALVLSMSCAGFAFSQKAALLSADEAVVISAVTSVKSSPAASSVDLFVLHEGTSVRILETAGPWHNIELRDGRQGWIKCDDVEII